MIDRDLTEVKTITGDLQKKVVLWLDDNGWNCKFSKGVINVTDIRPMQRALKLEHRLFLRRLRLAMAEKTKPETLDVK